MKKKIFCHTVHHTHTYMYVWIYTGKVLEVLCFPKSTTQCNCAFEMSGKSTLHPKSSHGNILEVPWKDLRISSPQTTIVAYATLVLKNQKLYLLSEPFFRMHLCYQHVPPRRNCLRCKSLLLSAYRQKMLIQKFRNKSSYRTIIPLCVISICHYK